MVVRMSNISSDLLAIARDVGNGFTGDEYWIDRDAAIADVAQALRACVAAQRERDAQICDERRKRCENWEDTHLLEEAAAAIRSSPPQPDSPAPRTIR